ncbi:DUF3883 domain-containing protein [Chryseobacterium sp. 18068]|uniref:DUF3883 domain-containing protein n=1 Tax=Chryseobacterium sp. 18068 TaxID=2681414 RepID=UPI00135AF71C|nr:DUF3883 domain-containing protein [Chryseobacterium sp. 18068]
MIESKNRELAISATSKIFEKVNDALRKRDTDKRWFWELLQNAKDTVVLKKGEKTPLNDPDRKVDVKIIFSKNENNETVLKFQHNGNPFQFSNHHYKYDDPKCLLLADSGKIEEDEEQREDVTGQFGTGFLSTHILSLRILVEGIFLDKNGSFNEFNFELDRQFKNKLQLAEKVEKSLDQYDSNFSAINPPSTFETAFSYFLDNHKDGIEDGIKVVENGIEGLESYIPFVLSFSKEIQSVEIFDDLLTQTYTSFHRSQDLDRVDKNEKVVNIEKRKRAIDNVVENDLSETEIIHISLISDLENHIDLATRIYPNSTGFELKGLNEKSSVLFCTFPLIGSEDWRFPVMFNSSKFYPETERNGITLIDEKDNGNKERVEQAVEIYKVYVKNCVDKSYENLLFLADTRYSYCPKWCDADWYNDVLNKIREFLLLQPVVTNQSGQIVNLQDTLFPTCPNLKHLKNYWELCYKYSSGIIPQLKDIEKWNQLLNVDYDKWDNLKFPLEKLLAEIEIFGTVKTLASEKFSDDSEKALQWLNLLYTYIEIEIEQKEIFNDFAVIPNQNGEFKKIDDLRFDVNIPEELKDILYLFEQDQRDKLIHKLFSLFREHKPLSVEDVSYSINKHITDKSKPETDNYIKGMFLMCSYFTSDQSERRNTIYGFSLDFFPNFTSGQQKILNNTSDFNWENVNRWIVKSIVKQIEKLENTENLQNYFPHRDFDKTVLWLDKFLNFLNNSKNDYKEFLAENTIIPNQNDDFCSTDLLHNDVDVIPNKLKDILYSLSNEKDDWKEILLRDGISLDLNKTKTLKEIAGLIDDLVKENRDNTGNYLIRDSILSLVKWVSDKKDEFNTEDLFKWFYLNKANLVLNTLDNSNDRDNIFDIIQSGQSLDTLARIAKSSLTDEQLNALVDSTELVGEFISWLTDRQIDNPDIELGNIGEEFLYYHLCNLLGEENIEWSKMNEYDFTIFNKDKSVRFYVDAKTTAKGISNNENVPFYMRTSQWNFLPKDEAKNKYLIARVFKNGNAFDVRFLNITPENLR